LSKRDTASSHPFALSLFKGYTESSHPFALSLSKGYTESSKPRHPRFPAMFWVYILKCADGSYYTGHTDNLATRLDQHITGACAGYTTTRLPVELAFSQ